MTSTQLVTANDLEAMGSDARFELIQGVLHEMSPSSYRSNVVLARLGAALFAHVDRLRLGQVTFGEAGFVLERDPDTVVAPDVAFVRRDRLPDPIPERGFFAGAPDLAIEIVSPTDEPGDLRRKQALYERAGVPLVWWIDPEQRTATVHATGQPVRHLTESEALDGASVVHGFILSLAGLFQS